ncbi:F-box/WD repeat-containing protein 7 [Aplysia californica]|uniref:F-box/WD repeat-containing protein 7 n=1 Tax=Aplysia californica TaxID=6500 RepID=A0ABM0JCV1_APLCA|nr:F-box/WD repeat-containing protein 7 [Aplysia californica]
MAGKKIDINTASVTDLENLAGVGQHRAEAIIKHRRESGGFCSVVDLAQVPGISPTIIEQNKDRIVCRCRTSPASKKKNGPQIHRRATRQQCSVQDLGDHTSVEPSVSGTDCPHSLSSPTTWHFTRSQSAALRLGQGCSTETPPAESATTTFIVTRSGGSCSKASLNNSGNEEDSGNDGDDEGDDRFGNADRADAQAENADRCSDGNLLDNQHAGEEAEDISDGEEEESVNNDDAESVLSQSGESLADDCDNDDDASDNGNNEDEETEEADPEEGEEGRDEAFSSHNSSRNSLNCSFRTTRSGGCSHREDSFEMSPVSRQSAIKRKSFGREDKEYDNGEGDVSPGKKLRMAMVSCHACGQSLAKVPRWRLAQMPRGKIPSKENPPPKMDDWLKTFQAWSNAERMMAVDELITLCDPTQVRHMMQVIEPQFQRDFISLLPKELALYVLSFLGPRDLLRAAQTCRYWRVLAEDNLLWREKCREEGIDEEMVYGSRMRRRHSSRSPFKALFMRQSQIEHNWRKGVKRLPKILKGHDDHVITCLEFCGNRVVSGSDDNTLKVWSVTSGKCLRTLIGHTGGVWSSQMSGTVVISGSTDRTLKVWNAETGQCRHTLYGHSSTVRCMSLHENQVVSGSRDATLRVWDVDTGVCKHILMGHVAAVRCVQFDGKRVVSGAYDYTVRVWDPETETCLHTLQGHSNRVYSLQFDGVHVVSGSLDTSIRVWDVESGNCLHTLIGHQSLTSGLELKDNILVSGNADSTVKVWDITTGQCLQTLQGPNKHQSAVTCLQFSKKFVITSSDDGTVKIWDLKTGEFLRNLVTLDSGGSGGVVWRLRCSNTRLVCAVGSRNGTEETKLMVLDFDVEDRKCYSEQQLERRNSIGT